ncbi:flagellar hook-length control protein FliK [uncultured Oscillibacter sp.]|uniref:flagellar hook-length control protein FliK n=1 Tax=uncultured Oscillibacter sp. TaxID=876091 RepID=UPI002625D83F|nr:flagellar hook-length control protein FliK [uncultured Oscillibacter sp.]
MDQIYNSMLYMTQTPAERPAAKPSQTQEKDSFHKQLEQASGKGESKTETAVQDQPQEGQIVTEDPQELEKQMALAAMAVMQNPVIPVEQVTAPEETAVTDVAGVELVVETADIQVTDAPVTAETVEIAPQEGAEEAVEQLPQEQARPVEAETQTAEDTGAELEVKVTTGEAGGAEQETDAQDTPQDGMEEVPVFQEVREIPMKVGEAPVAEETLETPVEDQIGPRLAEALKSGDTRVEIQLAPESLGKVTVEVTLREDGTLHVALHAENSQTRGLLERSADNLMAMLGRDARQEDQVEVPRQQESQQQNFYDGQQGREHQGREQQQEHRQERQGGEDFLHQLRLGLVPGDGE